MTREQARLLINVLFDAVSCSLPEYEFPLTICQMIDLRIAKIQGLLARFKPGYISKQIVDNKNEIAALQELKTLMAGK